LRRLSIRPPVDKASLIRYLSRHKSERTITRALLDIRVESVSVKGLTLDLGSSRNLVPSYYDYLESIERERVITVDVVKYNRPHVLADLERNLPFKDNSVQSVIMFNLLEHIYHHQNLCSEVHRVLKKGGICHIFVPFLYRIHEDPHDYFRYSEKALTHLLTESGFNSVTIESMGFGPFTAAWSFPFRILSRVSFLRILCVPSSRLSLKLDEIIVRRQRDPDSFAGDYALAYFATCRKDE